MSQTLAEELKNMGFLTSTKKIKVKPVKKTKPKTGSQYEKPKDKPEESDLDQQARNAVLEDKIAKAQLSKYKVETAKLNLKKEAKQVAEIPFMEFLYFGYMEKMNLDFLGMMKRLEPIVDNLVKEGDTKGLIKRVEKEIKTILLDVKKRQATDLKEFKSE